PFPMLKVTLLHSFVGWCHLHHLSSRTLNRVLWTPSRTYNRDENSVAREYDAWAKVSTTHRFLTFFSSFLSSPTSSAIIIPTNSDHSNLHGFLQEGILEHYWGEHIHLGYYR